MAANRQTIYGRVARWLVHDLRNPTQALSLITDLMSDEPAADDPDAIATIREATTHLAHSLELLDRLLRLVPPAAEPAPLAVADSLHFLAALHRVHRTGVALDVGPVPGAGLPAVRGVEHELEQILLNLVVNALDAIGEDPGGRIVIRAADDDGRVELSVSDSGPGVPPTRRDRLFEPVVHDEGREHRPGLGLTVSRYLAERSGGGLVQVPRTGRGAEFRLTLRRWR